MGAKNKAQGQGRGREIAGIMLLGFGVFSALSLVSMQAGRAKMMGPGGAATATGLYSLAGLGAYVLAGAMLVVALRCFRGRPLHGGFSEIFGTLGILSAGTMLLHLPFAGEKVTLRGPGGALGQWLGEIVASFVGGIGAGLVATMLLAVSILLMTEVRVAELMKVVDVVAEAAANGLAAAGRAVGRVIVAMFPEKGAAEDREQDDEDDDEEIDDDDRRALADETIADGKPVITGLEEEESEPAPVGRGRALAADVGRTVLDEEVEDDRPERVVVDHEAEERRAVSAVVAEVAAVECAAEAEADAKAASPAFVATAPTVAAPPVALAPVERKAQDLPLIVAPTGPAKPPALAPVVAAAALASTAKEIAGPIIVEQAFRTQLDEEKAKQAAAKDDGPGFIRLSDGDFELPATDLLEYIPPTGNDVDKQALLDMPSGSSRRWPTTACAAR